MTTAMPAGEAPPRCLRSDLEWLRSQLVAVIEAKPLAATATAAAIGFVLGGGLTPPTLGLLIQTGSRVAAARLGSALEPPGPEDADAGAEGSRV